MSIQDSGERTEFATGAVRDMHEGKGRCDLLPLSEVLTVLNRAGDRGDSIINNIAMFEKYGNTAWLVYAFREFAILYFKSDYTALLEVAIHYEEGCNKYGERNWQKGIPLHSFIDSAIRHYLKFKRGDNDERHDRAFLWNLLGAMWTVHNKPDMVDMPFEKQKEDD